VAERGGPLAALLVDSPIDRLAPAEDRGDTSSVHAGPSDHRRAVVRRGRLGPVH
jgi:hypothetical protein